MTTRNPSIYLAEIVGVDCENPYAFAYRPYPLVSHGYIDYYLTQEYLSGLFSGLVLARGPPIRVVNGMPERVKADLLDGVDEGEIPDGANICRISQKHMRQILEESAATDSYNYLIVD